MKRLELWFPKPMKNIRDTEAETAFVSAQSAYICVINAFDDGSGYYHGETISVLALPSYCRHPEVAAAVMRTTLENNKGAFGQRAFKTRSGLHGVHAWYLSNSLNPPPIQWEVHCYIVTNRTGRCIGLVHHLNARRDEDAQGNARQDKVSVDQLVSIALKYRY